MIDEATRQYLREIGRRGGQKSKNTKPREHFVMMGKLSAKKRNEKKLEDAKTKIEP